MCLTSKCPFSSERCSWNLWKWPVYLRKENNNKKLWPWNCFKQFKFSRQNNNDILILMCSVNMKM